tara:strand:+ start:763 stop:1398 length:636 start_codon:yes stop_codon:yes gene_type:complete
MSKRLTKHNIIGQTGGGDYKNNHWPHPMNEDFNNVMRSVVNIYGIGNSKEEALLRECKVYLQSRLDLLIGHKVRRDTEEHYKVMSIRIRDGFNKPPHERQKLIEESDLLLCVGDWKSSDAAIQEYKFATMLGKPKYEMYYNSNIPVEEIIRYLQPVRPIKDAAWDSTKQDNVLIYETRDGLLELMDGNHRHEFANRVGGVSHLSGWIIKEV